VSCTVGTAALAITYNTLCPAAVNKLQRQQQ
jgi:hypothetical protein